MLLGTPGDAMYTGAAVLYNVNDSAATPTSNVGFDAAVGEYTYQSKCSYMCRWPGNYIILLYRSTSNYGDTF